MRSARSRYSGAFGIRAGAVPGICCIRSKNWTIAKPKPISEIGVCGSP
jgi:hypothetical protein